MPPPKPIIIMPSSDTAFRSAHKINMKKIFRRLHRSHRLLGSGIGSPPPSLTGLIDRKIFSRGERRFKLEASLAIGGPGLPSRPGQPSNRSELAQERALGSPTENFT